MPLLGVSLGFLYRQATGKGLVGYDCGYKAGVDYFDLGEVDD